MTDTQSFSRIKVTPAEDEDIVIVAGLCDTPPATGRIQSAQVIGSDSEPDQRASQTPKEAHEKAAHVAESQVTERVQTSEESASSHDAYHPTTLDDIKSSSMPTTQKVVIGLAIIAIIAFVVWRVCFAQ